MPAPLTPIERFLREDTNDRRTKYEKRRAAQGLVRVNVWVPEASREELAEVCRGMVAAHLERLDGAKND
jgi:hypothetical protein